jgi:hypothetical protein
VRWQGVEHLTHYLKIEGSNPATCTGRENKKKKEKLCILGLVCIKTVFPDTVDILGEATKKIIGIILEAINHVINKFGHVTSSGGCIVKIF